MAAKLHIIIQSTDDYLLLYTLFIEFTLLILSFGIVLFIATSFLFLSFFFFKKSGLVCDIYSPKYQKDLLFYYLSGDISADAMWEGSGTLWE